MFCFSPLIAQKKYHPLPHVDKESPFDIAPQFKGGSNAMMKYFSDSIRYPEPEKTKRKQGSVLMKFIVNEKGKIENIHIINGVAGAPNFVAEAKRVVESMPDWIPATKKGKNVSSEYQLSIPFKLNKSGSIYHRSIH